MIDVKLILEEFNFTQVEENWGSLTKYVDPKTLNKYVGQNSKVTPFTNTKWSNFRSSLKLQDALFIAITYYDGKTACV